MYKASLKSSLTPCIRSEHASFTNAKRHSVLFEQQVQFNKASVDAAETAERRYSFILSSLVAGDSGVQRMSEIDLLNPQNERQKVEM